MDVPNRPEPTRIKNTIGETPLHLAAETGQKGVAELLLMHGADVNAKNTDGLTPLHLAARGGYKKVIELLHQHAGRE
jgi:ankyrin repeat protein